MTRAEEFFYSGVESPLGPLWLVSSRERLCWLTWKRTRAEFLSAAQKRMGTIPKENETQFQPWRDRLSRYFQGERITFDGPTLFSTGTLLQQSVWWILQEIPYGETRSYQWVASRLRMASGARVIGNACGRNPLPIIIPCHRVIRKNQTLGGYTGGIKIKQTLLEIEHGHPGCKP